jgi:hypothetical protein
VFAIALLLLTAFRGLESGLRFLVLEAGTGERLAADGVKAGLKIVA